MREAKNMIFGVDQKFLKLLRTQELSKMRPNILTFAMMSILMMVIVATPMRPAMALTVDCWPIRLDGTCLPDSVDRIRITNVAVENGGVKATLTSVVGNLTLAATYIVEVMDERGSVVFIKEKKLLVDSGSSLSFSDELDIEENGSYTVKLFVWSHDLDEPLPLLMVPAVRSFQRA
jgi:hypothetical protein